MKKLIAAFVMSVLLIGHTQFAKAAEPLVESSKTPNIKRDTPLPTLEPLVKQQPRISSFEAQPQSAQLQAVTETLGPNLIQNPSFESGSTNSPTSWLQNRWSNNIGAFTYPVAGINSGKAVQATITSYTSGDAKWYFADTPVKAGKTYQFSNHSFSNVPTVLTARFKLSDGTYTYKYLTQVAPGSSFKQTTVRVTAPTNATAVSVFHVIQSVGSLTVDEYSLNEIQTSTTPPPPEPTPTPSGNLIKNGDFETQGSSGAPLNWVRNSWGGNTSSGLYPAPGVNGSKAAQVTISSYSSGDTKWVFDPVNVTAGTYRYTDQYTSTQPNNLTAQFHHSNGSVSYQYLKTLPASSGFTQATADFTVPSTVVKVIVFHYIQSVGSLTIDNASLTSLTQSSNGIFSTGAVSLTFDDATLDHYQIALPKLNATGLKGTFYIPSRQLRDNGFSGYMSRNEVIATHNAGHEIGAHTRTHAHLTQLSEAQQRDEIQGSRSDLQAMNVGSVSTFAYPFGEYNQTTMRLVQEAGYSAARSTIRGQTISTSDKFQLPEFSMESSTTFAQVQQQIDSAIANKKWLIFAIHHIDNSGEQYSIKPELFNQVVDYLKQKNVPVVTVAQGIQSLSQ